jgi:hypothetical protein
VSLDHNFHAEYRQSAANRGKLLAKHLLPGYDRDRATALFREYPGHYAEGSQRDAVLAHMFDVSDGEGWVVVSDVDEFVDCSTSVRRDQLVDALRSGANVTRLRRQRFTFDIDNFCPATRFVGCASIAYLRERSLGLQSVRLGHDGFVPTLDALVYEYSFCYPRAAIDRKLATYVHSDPGATSVAVALECNHFFFGSAPKRIDPDLWYRRVPLETAGVPEYVLANADHLRTGNVSDDYEERRARRYPDLFGWDTSHARLLR